MDVKGKNKCATHEIDLIKKTCNLRCLENNGVICEEMKFFCDKMKINTHSMYPPKYKVMYGIKKVEYMIGDVCIDNIETDINALDISQVPILPRIISRHKGRQKKEIHQEKRR